MANVSVVFWLDASNNDYTRLEIVTLTTEGIIQKVFRDNTIPPIGVWNYTNTEVRQVIDRIQQELITEIKKHSIWLTIHELIGDES